ncbi:MAG: peptide ABC transporter substrate-binding protein [Candidatus Hydrogenedentes bacterium]|nr:peptide ABC transporter substrate-binding protein [Candidatus Hydrogenedentota bacterium]
MKLRASLCVGVALILTCAVGCTSGGGNAADGAILHVGAGAEPQNLDPYRVTGHNEHRILTSLFEGLTTLNQVTLAVEPGAAESWTVSPDGLVYTFKLNPNAKWSNGTPVTAKDFVYGWKRHLSARLGSEYAYMLWCIVNAEEYTKGKVTDFSQVGVKALDDTTLEVTLKYPVPAFLTMHIHYSWFPVLQSNVEAFGAIDDPNNTKWTLAGNMISNGPFKLVEWSPNQIIRVTRNDFYWDAANVKLDGVEFYPYSNLPTEEREFRAGRLDVTESLLATKIETYRREHPELLHIDPMIGTYFYRLNVTRKPLDNPKVRRALAMSIDRQSICDNVLFGAVVPAAAFTPPGLAGYTPEASIPYNVEEARKLLAEAGYPNGEGMRPLDILFNESEDHRRIAEAIQDMWKKNLNVDARPTQQEWKVYLNSMTTLDYDVARSAWIADYLDPINYLECFETGGGNNRTGWSSPEFDALVAKTRLSPDQEVRFPLLQQAERLLLDEAPLAPIYSYRQRFLLAPRVQGLKSNMLGYLNYKSFSISDAN